MCKQLPFAAFRANYHRYEAATGVDQRDNTKDKQ